MSADGDDHRIHTGSSTQQPSQRDSAHHSDTTGTSTSRAQQHARNRGPRTERLASKTKRTTTPQDRPQRGGEDNKTQPVTHKNDRRSAGNCHGPLQKAKSCRGQGLVRNRQATTSASAPRQSPKGQRSTSNQVCVPTATTTSAGGKRQSPPSDTRNTGCARGTHRRAKATAQAQRQRSSSPKLLEHGTETLQAVSPI